MNGTRQRFAGPTRRQHEHVNLELIEMLEDQKADMVSPSAGVEAPEIRQPLGEFAERVGAGA